MVRASAAARGELHGLRREKQVAAAARQQLWVGDLAPAAAPARHRAVAAKRKDQRAHGLRGACEQGAVRREVSAGWLWRAEAGGGLKLLAAGWSGPQLTITQNMKQSTT